MSELGFDEAADFYRFRTPYNKNIFPQIANALDCTAGTIILDLACGDGALSHAISSYVGRVVAIDSSAAMLAKAQKAQNVIYLQHDFSKEGVRCSPRANHVFIGRAIQYLAPHLLEETFKDSLLPEARVLVLGSTFTKSEPWVPAYHALRMNYVARELGEISGAKTLENIGYERINTIQSETIVRVTEEYLVKNTLSYGGCTKNVLANLPVFREKLRKLLEPHLEGGTVKAKIFSWAYVYGRK
jgi:ubiquinone/menaquinone biosynthesis C-methylase UbiE